MSRKQNTIETLPVLTTAATIVRKHGWTSKGAARFNPALTPTASRVLDALDGVSKIPRPSKADKATVAATVTWVGSLVDSTSDYENKLYSLFFDDDGRPKGEIPEKAVGFAVSAVGVYVGRAKRDADDAKLAKEAGPYVGNMGERIDFVGTLVEKRYSARWDCFAHVWTDDNGSRLSWFTRMPQAEIGDVCKVRGTVKDHAEFRGVRNTKLTRCRVTVQ